MADSFFWVPHDQEVWLPGKALGDDAYQTGKGEIKCAADKRGPEIADTAEMEGVEDCCTLTNVCAANILHTTRVRYMRGEIYTNVSNVLIAVNPFKAMQIYGQEQIIQYRSATDRSTLPPHIFGICAEAFSGLFEENSAMQSSQAVLISGESGAGKTETTKLVLLYTSEMLSGQEGGLEDLLMEINPILEAFGNAKTTRNNNSSRFGKWIEVCVDPAARALKGVHVVDYLLEVTRICGQGPGERNYHIFYQLAADDETREQLNLAGVENTTYLKSNKMAIEGMDDKAELASLRKALTTLNFSPSEEQGIFQISAAVIHIGSLEFAGTDVKIKNEDALKIAADLLQVDIKALEKVICQTRRVAGKDIVFSPNDEGKAKQARDSFAKMMYGMMFKWIVGRCNQALGEGLGEGVVDGKSAGPFLGVLDIAGFESFEKNLLEQLLINLSNEKLQQFYNDNIFKSELAEYQEENIDVKNIIFADNAQVLALIEGAGGVLAMLDDATNGVKQTDELLVQKLLKEKASHANFLKPKKFDPLLFGISHYAGQVFYDATGFLEKNSSTQPPEFLELMKASQLNVLSDLVGDIGGDAGGAGPKKGGKKPTVSGAYKKSLQSLMDKLKTAKTHFVRCIKPNAEKQPDIFTSPMVMDQLKLCGVMETVEIRKAGFLVRSKYSEFTSRYLIIVPKEDRKQLKSSGDLNKTAKRILEIAEAAEGQWALGKTKVFLKSTTYQTLEAMRRASFGPHALQIQKVWRGFEIRRQMVEVREVHAQMKKCIEEAGHSLREQGFSPKRVDRPSLAEGTLKHFDILLMRAVNLPIKLAYIHEATKVRVHIAAEAQLARKLENLSLQLNVYEMEEALAAAANYRMEGALVEKVKTRLEAVKMETPIKEALHAAFDLDELESLQKAVQDATEKGLDDLKKWTMPSGASIMEKAHARMLELEEEKRKREAFLAALAKEVEEQCTSSDLAAVQEVLARAAAAGIQSEMVDKLAARCANLEIHLGLHDKLQECVIMNDIEAIQAIIKMAEDQGIRTDEWTLPSGADDLAQAEKRIAELQAEKEAEERARQLAAEKLLNDLKAALTSSDYQYVKELMDRGKENYPASKKDEFPEQVGVVEELQLRLNKMEEESSIMKRMQSCMDADDKDAFEELEKELEQKGMTSEDGWVLSEAFQCLETMRGKFNAHKQRGICLERMKQVAAEMDVKALQQEISKAVELGLAEADYKTYNQLCNKLQNTNHVRDLMSKHKGNDVITNNLKSQLDELMAAEAGSGSVIELKLQRLAKSNNTEMMRQALREADRAEVKGDIVDEIRALCVTLERQQPHLAKLQEALWTAEMETLKKAIDDFKESEGEDGMAHPDQWPCEGLQNFYDKACQKLEQMAADRPDNENIEAKLHLLKNSIDVVAMREALKEAERAKFTGEIVDELSNRFKTLEKQKAYLMSIRHCVLSRDPQIVRGVLEEGIKYGLDNPETWLLDDGPRSYALLNGYLKELEVKKQGDDATVAAVNQKLQSLSKSTDINEIRAALVKAAANNLKSELVTKLTSRAQSLEKQGPLLKELKGVLRSVDAEQVQVYIQRVRDMDLVNPNNWVYPDGPKVFSKVIARKLFCEKVEDLGSSLTKAIAVYNVREMEDCFKAAEYLGVPNHRFQDAKDVFLKLQSAEHVEELLEKFKQKLSSEGEDDVINETITCLCQQLVHLGYGSDHKALQGVSERIAHNINRPRNRKSVYYSAEASKGQLAEAVFGNLANLKSLRDPLTWATEYSVSLDPESRTKDMVSFQTDKIVQSLTILKAHSERIATQNFLDLLRCMGDKPCAYTGDKQDPIIKRLTVSRGVCDEIYVQVIKQLTKNPSVTSATKGWELLIRMVKEALPSAEVFEFLLAFVSREAKETETSDGKDDKKRGWRQALLNEAKRQIEEAKREKEIADGKHTLAGVAQQAVQHAKSADRRKSMADRLLAREKRKSRVAMAEDRLGDIEAKRKAFAPKQRDMAKMVLEVLTGGKTA